MFYEDGAPKFWRDSLGVCRIALAVRRLRRGGLTPATTPASLSRPISVSVRPAPRPHLLGVLAQDGRAHRGQPLGVREVERRGRHYVRSDARLIDLLEHRALR